MNTEFPSRVPQVQQQTSSSSNLLSSKDVQQVSDNELQDLVKGLVSDFKSMVNTMANIIKNRNEDKAEDKKDKEKDKKELNKFQKVMLATWNGITDVFKDIKKTLGNLATSLNDGIASALGSVFGGGKFGEAVSNLYLFVTRNLWRGLQAVGSMLWTGFKMMGKLLGTFVQYGAKMAWGLMKLVGTAARQLLFATVGFLFSPTGLILMAILAAVGLVVYYAEEIWSGIKWLGYMFDQGFESFITALSKVVPFWDHQNKYDTAYDDQGAKLGIEGGVLKDIIGDSIRTRNMVYEANKGNEEAQKELADLFAKKNAEYMSKMTHFNTYGSGMNLMSAAPSNTSQLPQMIRDVTVTNKIENTTMIGGAGGFQTLDEISEGLNKSINTTLNSSSSKTTNNYGSLSLNASAPGANSMGLSF